MLRKLGVTHMAFYRGYLQGLTLREVADLYLETGLDLRVAKSTLGWVQDELRRAALRHGRHGEARLLRVRITDIHTVAGEGAALPSIDDFREAVDPTGFYGFDELMVHYLERYPQAGNDRAKRRAALLQRQIAALNWIEGLLVTAPVPADPVAAWLDSNLVERLRNGGIHTLAELMGRITERGFRWYGTVPQLGAVRAARLVRWLTAYETSLGTLPASTRVSPRSVPQRDRVRPLVLLTGAAADPQAPVIAPLESLLLPQRAAVVSGAGTGADHDRRCFIAADNDRDAITAWLNALSGSVATARAYRKEAERLVLWAMAERGQTLGQLTVETATGYRDFLCDLGRVTDAAWRWRIPQAQWLAPRATRRYSPAWRPFAGPLSPSSVAYALTVCHALTRWLVHQGYLPFNPWEHVARPRAVVDQAPDLELSRMLTAAQWDALMAAAGTVDDGRIRRRDQLILRLALVTGLRLSELVGARCENVRTAVIKHGGGTRWMLDVRGKGDQWRAVPLLPDVVERLQAHLRDRGLPPDPRSAPEGTPVIAGHDGSPLSSSGLAWILKQAMHRAADQLAEQGHAEDAGVLGRASAHWIRHTTGARLGDAGVPASQIQQLLGHASLATTTIYTQTALDEVYRSAAKTFTVGSV